VFRQNVISVSDTHHFYKEVMSNGQEETRHEEGRQEERQEEGSSQTTHVTHRAARGSPAMPVGRTRPQCTLHCDTQHKAGPAIRRPCGVFPATTPVSKNPNSGGPLRLQSGFGHRSGSSSLQTARFSAGFEGILT